MTLEPRNSELCEPNQPADPASLMDDISMPTTTTNFTSPPALQTLSGTATFILLGGSRLVGTFDIDPSDEGGDFPSLWSIPFHGSEVTSYRECTRDMEWSIVKLHFIGLPAVIAERTGGDAMRLKAPVQWQGDEAEVALDLARGCCQGIELEFECHSLLADAAADEELGRIMPGAVGMGAMVNIGPMIVRKNRDAVGDDDDDDGFI